MSDEPAERQVANPVERYYDRLSGQYDDITTSTGAWTAPRKLGALIKQRYAPGLSWLVVGVGTGHDLEPIFATAPSHVEAIDLSGGMLDIARRNHPGAVYHHGDFTAFDAFALPRYDVVVCTGVLEFCRDSLAFLQRCARLLSERGSIIISFEPVIEGYGLQDKATSELHVDEVVGIDIFGLRIHRIGLQDFLDQVREAGLETTMLDAFVAFVRGDERVIYNLAVLQRRSRDG